MQADAFISQLSSFDKNDLLQIHQLTEILLGSSQLNDALTLSEEETILFDAIRTELSTLGLNNKIPYRTLKGSAYYKSWQEGLGVVNQFLERHFSPYIKTKIQRIGITRIIIQVLLIDMKRLRIPISLGSIARNLHRVPQTFDNQFPNYIQSGLAHLVIQAMTQR